MASTSRVKTNPRSLAAATRDSKATDSAEIRRLQVRIGLLQDENAELLELTASLYRRTVDLIAATDPAVEIAARDFWWSEGRRAGFVSGISEGYREALADISAELLDVDEPAPWPQTLSNALDRLRYPPLGRRHFGDPRPGDFAGAGE